ncbi:hypothetical protein D9613_003341 [Agrocybe pediades]|uniref:F-box domain-containing protein n=1 Tax=Agrocybe pediades TaxID=84607 RepID=A0A8H4QPM5_9AGAR|nr:hypothetical protein D9613_003341 [Agrocybe pediades]
MRRSTRVASRKTQPAEPIFEEDQLMDEFTPDDDDSDGEDEERKGRGASKKKRGTKRKKPANKATNPTPAKKLRGTRGRLKDILEMPMDILVEIFGHLDPLDLIHLTWTTKAFRALLLSKNGNSYAIWKSSIANVPGLPPCPEDLSEPKYAHLTFVNICHRYGRKTTSIGVFWYARARLCKGCAEQEFCLEVYELNDDWIRNMSRLRPLIPSAELKSGTYRRRPPRTYHGATCARWEKEYEKAEDKEAWLNNKIETQHRVADHCDDCRDWLCEVEAAARAAKKSEAEGRKPVVLEMLKNLGWSEEIAMLEANEDSFAVHPLDHSAVVRASKKKITDQVLADLKPILVAYMENVKEARLHNVRSRLLRARLPLLEEVYKPYVAELPANTIYPSLADIFFHPDVQDIMDLPSETEVTSRNFDQIRSSFSTIVSQVLDNLECQVKSMIPSSCIPCGETGTGHTDTLSLAVATFLCANYQCTHATGLRYPQMLFHSCSSLVDIYLMSGAGADIVSDEDRDVRTIRNTTGSTKWNVLRRIKFDEAGYNILTQALEMCGRDPKTTTAADMDSEMPIFECITCHSRHEGRLVMPWYYLTHHRKNAHRDGVNFIPFKFCLLDDADAANARVRLLEQQQRGLSAIDSAGMICMHCKQVGHAVELKDHVEISHNISQVTENDIAPCIGYNNECESMTSIRLWPPRLSIKGDLI